VFLAHVEFVALYPGVPRMLFIAAAEAGQAQGQQLLRYGDEAPERSKAAGCGELAEVSTDTVALIGTVRAVAVAAGRDLNSCAPVRTPSRLSPRNAGARGRFGISGLLADRGAGCRSPRSSSVLRSVTGAGAERWSGRKADRSLGSVRHRSSRYTTGSADRGRSCAPDVRWAIGSRAVSQSARWIPYVTSASRRRGGDPARAGLAGRGRDDPRHRGADLGEPRLAAKWSSGSGEARAQEADVCRRRARISSGRAGGAPRRSARAGSPAPISRSSPRSRVWSWRATSIRTVAGRRCRTDRSRQPLDQTRFEQLLSSGLGADAGACLALAELAELPGQCCASNRWPMR
jgi:hypothetical protein